MKMLIRAAAGLSALLACLVGAAPPAFAQSPRISAPANNGATVPTTGLAYGAKDATATFVDEAHPLPSMVTTTAAASTPLVVTVTSSAATKVSGEAGAACSIASSVAKCGPFTPQLGRAIRVITSQSSAFTAPGGWYFGTSADGCATVNRLTSDDTLKADWTGQVNDYADVLPTTGGVVGCIVFAQTGLTGSASVAVRQ